MGTLIQKKICMVGDFSVGKTSLVRRFVYNLFEERYLTTIGVNITRKDIQYPDDRLIRLLIWDLADAAKFNGTRSSYLQGASGALLISDLSRPESLLNLKGYCNEIRNINPKAVIMVIGNKVDLVVDDIQESIQNVRMLAAGMDTSCQFTSAKTGEGVETAFAFLLDGIISSNRG